jgi:ribosomal protein L1
VFADSERHAELKEIGADVIGNEEVLRQIASGVINFEKIIATPE